MEKQQRPRIGMEAIDNDDHFIGTVENVEGDHLVVQKGFFFPKSHRIANDTIGTINENELTLRISREEATQQNDDTNWAEYPERGELVPQVGDVEKSDARGEVDPH